MKNIVIMICIIVKSFLLLENCNCQEISLNIKGPYLGQKPPGKKAVLFAPDIINYEVHESVVISPDETELFVGAMSIGMKYYKMVNGMWSTSETLPFNIPDRINGFYLSPNGRRVYFLIWEKENDENFWFIEKKATEWTKLCSLGDKVNSFETHWQFSVASNENLYFASGAKILVSRFIENNHSKPTPLKLADNTDLAGGTPFIAPDESYIIFSMGKNNRDKFTDLYISYALKNDKWSEPINLGEDINISSNFDLCPKISPNGKFMFFISRRNGPDFQMFWVDAGFIDDLKKSKLK